jgi:YihY family inner membrane protein
MPTETQNTSEAQTQHKNSSSGFIDTVKKDIGPFQAFFTKFNNDWSMNFAGLLAYNLLMAMLPIAIATIGILGLILAGNQELKQQVLTSITHAFPGLTAQQNVMDLATTQLQKDAGVLVVIAILLAIFGGSRLFITIEGCLDIIYRVRPRTAIRQNIMALGMLLLFIALIPIMVFVSAAPTVLLSLISNNPALKSIPFLHEVSSNPIVSYLAAAVGGVIVCFLLFETIYMVVPNQRISWQNSWRGAIIAAVALELFLIFFPIYTRYFLGGYAGPVGFAVILLLFFYYFAVILMVGAEVNAFFFEGVRPIPNDLPTFVSTMAGKLNRDLSSVEGQAHQDTRPTDAADRAHIARDREKEEQNRQKNLYKQHAVASTALAQNTAKKEHKQPKGPSKLITAMEVAIGSALAMGIELFRQRQRRKL